MNVIVVWHRLLNCRQPFLLHLLVQWLLLQNAS